MSWAATRRWAGPTVVLALLTVAGCAPFSEAARSATARAKVGDCIDVLEGSAADARTAPVDCSSDRAVYTVMSASGKKQDCGPEYWSYEEDFDGNPTAFLCLAPDLKQSSCYHQDRDNGFSYVDCTAADATVEVVKRIDGRDDRFLCPPEATFLLLTRPEITYCLVNPRS